MKKQIVLKGKITEYDFQVKNVKNINLRIKPDCTVTVSAPSRVSSKQIEDFIVSKADFILNALKKYENGGRVNEYVSGETVYIFGLPYTVRLCSGREFFALDKGDVILRLKNPLDAQKRKKAYSNGACALLREYIVERCLEIYPAFSAYTAEFPQIKIKNMKSRWGSCHRAKNILSFSLMLAEAPKECIDSVIYHEFCHFAVGNHSKDFYTLLLKFVPDYKRLTHILNKRTYKLSV